MTTRVEHIMGTAISLDLRTASTPAPAVDAAFAHLRDIDARFSTYRPESEVSRLGEGELREAQASADVRHVLAVCDHLARASDGAFEAPVVALIHRVMSRAGRSRRPPGCWTRRAPATTSSMPAGT